MRTFEYTEDTYLKSSFIHDLSYNANTQELAVELENDTYFYGDVDRDLWDALVRADSKGQFYTYHIKNNDGVTKLGSCENEDVEYSLELEQAPGNPWMEAENEAGTLDEQNTYHISYDIGGTTYVTTAAATDDVAALSKVSAVFDSLGLTPKFVEILRHFDEV